MADHTGAPPDDAKGINSIDSIDSNAAERIDVEVEPKPIDTTVGDAALIAAARRRHGALGGIVAAGMLGIDKVLGRKPREEIPVVVDAPTEPIDIDTAGITVALDDTTDVISPPLPRTPPVMAPGRRRRR